MAVPPPAPIRGPRTLLRQIREAMGGPEPTQAKLTSVVRIIASSMVAEVCSIYLRRATGELELFATEGLDPGAVHVTQLKPGEGLVGEIMRTGRPLNLSDAASHPAFSYRPETHEDPFHAFLAAPLLRGGRAIGVLVVQNRATRVYSDDDVEDLQIVAMVLTEMVAGGDLLSREELKDVEIAPHRSERLKGVRFADGLALGVAVLHEAPVPASRLLADDVAAEEVRLAAALETLQAQIDRMLEGQEGRAGPSYEVLETYRMLAHSRTWMRSLQDAVHSGLTAEAAVERVRSEHRAGLGQARDPYLRERLHDLEDLNDRLLRHLSGNGETARRLPDNAVLIARNLGPADLLEYDRSRLRGLLLEEGSPASHAAIVARAMGIPCVGRLPGLRDRVSEGDQVIVDGETYEAYLRPRPDVVKAVKARIAARALRLAEFARLKDTPAFTRDGAKISLLMNAGLAVDLETLPETGAEGIGLFRTEFQFMVADDLPRLSAQTELYARVFDAAEGRAVTFRTLDLGGDKVAPYLQVAEREDNPALGWRAVRMGLDRPALLRLQLRALIAAADGRPLSVMFPLIASVDEFRAARALVDTEIGWSVRRGRPPPSRLEVGAMVEAPALLWHLDALLPLTDFVSVGTNDLLQYLFAADRGNPLVADRYDPLSPPFLRALRQIREACADTGTPVSVCGEIAGRPLEAFALIALGYDRLSMPASGIGPVKQMVLSVDREAARRGIASLLGSHASSVRGEVEALGRKIAAIF
ncbi:MAG TPA: phosphoenolpyruvate--protein phosphotransferase [Caulobacteraceae bacterium]|jgi:phosphotransferase system enzyme I (PtsP)|nr:phosphoenolpyruvate--protein phosphotransferase [Caulobacteraceae bacterium]